MLASIEADILISRGQKILASGDCEKAISCFNKALKRNPKAIQAYIHLARVYTSSGKFNKAEQMAKRALESDPLNPSYHLYLGQIYYDSGNFGDAYDEFNQILQDHRENKLAYAYLALSLYNLGERQRAIEIFKEKGIPNNVDFLCHFTALFESEMIEHPERFSKITEEHIEMTTSLTYRTYVKLKNVFLLGKVAKYFFIRRFLRKASKYLEFGNSKTALEIFIWIQSIEPELIEAEFGKGLCLIDLKRFETAKESFLLLAERNPNEALFLVYLGICYYHLKDYTSAISLLENAPISGPEDYNANYFLGLSFLAIGEKKKASAAFQKSFTKYYVDTFEECLKKLIQKVTSVKVK